MFCCCENLRKKTKKGYQKFWQEWWFCGIVFLVEGGFVEWKILEFRVGEIGDFGWWLVLPSLGRCWRWSALSATGLFRARHLAWFQFFLLLLGIGVFGLYLLGRFFCLLLGFWLRFCILLTKIKIFFKKVAKTVDTKYGVCYN